MMKEKILIIGNVGSLGKALEEEFSHCKIPFKGINRDDFNIEDNAIKFIEILESINIVINCVAMTGLDYCYRERKNALSTNYFFPKKIATICQQLNTKLIQFSTENVFACEQKGYLYKSSDIPSPVSWYGVSKYLGEQATLSAKQTIIRLPMMFGPSNKTQLISKLIDSLRLGVNIQAADDVFTTPTYTPDVAKWISSKLLSSYSWDENIIHLSGDKLLSIYDLITTIAKKIQIRGKVEPVNSELFLNLEFKSKYGGLESPPENRFSFEESVTQYSNFLMKGINNVSN